MRFIAFTLPTLLAVIHGARADVGSALYPPGLQPLIAKANVLLSTGQFNDAARVYSEAIEQAPTEYLLRYKRATAYLSLNRHQPALDDFQKVYELSGNSFDNALLMISKIHTKEGQWSEARAALAKFTKVKGEASGADVRKSITEGESAAKQAHQTRNAQLWTACTEHASLALRFASHSTELRQLRAECALASGDIEGAVGDLTRLTHLTTPTVETLMRVYRLAYFFLPPPTAGSANPAMTPLKQCLHRDPDSKPCLTAHRLIKKFEKSFVKLEKHLAASEWRSVLALLSGKSGLIAQFEENLKESTTVDQLRGTDPSIPLPNATKASPRRKILLGAICKAYTKVNEAKIGEKWCDALLAMDGSDEDPDGLAGKGAAAMLREDWEMAVRLLQQAFESTGRSDNDMAQRLQKARAALKQSKQKDYYKVLDVARNADAKTIKKAYRKAVLKAHPDKGGTEAKMAAVNEAYEVLKSDELRERFDGGDDPNDPMSGQGGPQYGGGGGFHGQHHPFSQFFQQGGSHGGGGGFQFHYGN